MEDEKMLERQISLDMKYINIYTQIGTWKIVQICLFYLGKSKTWKKLSNADLFKNEFWMNKLSSMMIPVNETRLDTRAGA